MSCSLRDSTEFWSDIKDALTIRDSDGAICVLQGEIACVDLSASGVPAFLVSTEATTCIIAVALIGDTAIMSHLDSTSACSEYVDRLRSVSSKAFHARPLEPSHGTHARTIHVWVLGAYAEPSGLSQALVKALQQGLDDLHKNGMLSISLRGSCVLKRNLAGTEQPGPKWKGLAFDVQHRIAIPANYFGDAIGAIRRRGWRWVVSTTEHPLLDIWRNDLNGGVLALDALSFALPLETITYLDEMLQADDSKILTSMSTSPDDESPGFCQSIRLTMEWLLCNQKRPMAATSYRWKEEDRVWEMVTRTSAELGSREPAVTYPANT